MWQFKLITNQFNGVKNPKKHSSPFLQGNNSINGFGQYLGEDWNQTTAFAATKSGMVTKCHYAVAPYINFFETVSLVPRERLLGS